MNENLFGCWVYFGPFSLQSRRPPRRQKRVEGTGRDRQPYRVAHCSRAGCPTRRTSRPARNGLRALQHRPRAAGHAVPIAVALAVPQRRVDDEDLVHIEDTPWPGGRLGRCEAARPIGDISVEGHHVQRLAIDLNLFNGCVPEGGVVLSVPGVGRIEGRGGRPARQRRRARMHCKLALYRSRLSRTGRPCTWWRRRAPSWSRCRTTHSPSPRCFRSARPQSPP